MSSSPQALSKALPSSTSTDDITAVLDDAQHELMKESIKLGPASATTSSISPAPSPQPLDMHFAATLSPLPSACVDDSTTSSSSSSSTMALPSVNPISTTQPTYSSTRLTISTGSDSTALPSATAAPPNVLQRHVSLGSGRLLAAEDADEGSLESDEAVVVVVAAAARLGRQDSLDGENYVEVQEEIVDVTDCLDSLDLSLDTDALPAAAPYNVRVTSTEPDEMGAAERGGSMSLLAHGSVTQQRLHMAGLSNTPSPSPRMTPSPTHSQGSAAGSIEGTPEGGAQESDERRASLGSIVVLPPATAFLSGGTSSSGQSSSAALASSLAATSAAPSSSSIPAPVLANRTASGSYSSPFLTVPPLATIPYIHPSAPPVSGSPPPTSPFLSPPSRAHRHHHRHHLTNSPTRRKHRTVSPQPSSPHSPPHPASPHRHSDAEVPSASPTSPTLSHSSSTSSLYARARTIETTSVSTSYNQITGQKQINQYVVEGGELGSGTSGEVKLVFSLTDQQYYAMKEVSKSKAKKKRLKKKDQQDMWEQLKREIAIMKKVDHRNVVRLVEVMDDPHNDRLYLVMEYVELGHVGSSEMPEPIPLHLVKQYVRDALLGLDYLHYHAIIHRDIKPDNLLLSATGECKIGDLGMSTVLSSTQELLHEYSAGTPAYRPPEMCQGQGFSGQAADVWSLGVTMYFLLYAQLPFWGSSEMLLAQSIIDKELVFPDESEAVTVEPVDAGCQRFIARMLEKEPRRRVSVEEMLRDDWLTDSGQWRPDRSWREREELERRRKAREERRAARGAAGDDGKEEAETESSDDEEDGSGAVLRHEIIVTPAEVSESITVVSRLLLMVKLKRKMRKHRRALGSRARSVSLDDRLQDRLGHYSHKEKAAAGGAANSPAVSRWAGLVSGTRSHVVADATDQGGGESPPSDTQIDE